MHDVCKAFYRAEKQDQSLMNYFMTFKRTYEELNVLLPFSPDVKVQQRQREQMAIMSFLAGLSSDFDSAKSQVLSGSDVSSLQDVFSRVLRTETTPSVSLNSALVGHNNHAPWRNSTPSGSKGGNSQRPDNRTPESGSIMCNYCKKPGHTKFECKKLQFKNQQKHYANVANTSDAPDRSVTISADEFAKFSRYQESLQSSSPSVTAIADSGKSNACLLSTSSKWVIDSGATDHMTGNSSLFSTFQSYSPTSSVTLADGSPSSVLGSGTVTPTPLLTLSSVLHLPNLSFNLLSVSQLTRNLNCCISFFPDHCLFQDLMTKKIIGKGHESGGLYVLDPLSSTPIACPSVASAFEAHCRLGHPSLPLLKKLCPQYSKVSSLDCESCQFAKHHRVSLSPRVNKRASVPFELVHSDVWGPSPILSKPGFRYFVTFVDDYSRVTWLYLMKNRSELFPIFCAFCAKIQNQFNVHVRTLRSDNAKEYTSAQFQSYMISNGMLHETSCVDTAPQNGVAERKNRHLLETARALLFQMKVPKPFWADAVSTACFLINRMPSSVLNGEIPFKILFPVKSLFPVAHRVFGSVCFARDVRPHVTKLDPKSLKCVFLGYSRLQKGYRCYCPDLNKYLVSIDVTFVENTPYFSSSPTPTRHGDDDDLLVYSVTTAAPDTCSDESLVPSPTSVIAPAMPTPPPKPPIIVYSRRPPPVSCPAPASSSSDSELNDDLPIALRKEKLS
ncbi:retrovirus-related Pol polyprotein from transposon RE1 isoform X1 [Humulus lupulus]|uniref:retrovirus-related Pol polyprotein from transposon RE1 isoform X1 n=2 Tax=Humulus lupulus TaxID=3486 RepID=UPI002B407E3D|nr:retrovirus-related Pol polyprotein from transposon RE1 isoform X1 [Humulus lupulus]